MCDRLSSITGIDASILSHAQDLGSVSVAKRMSWASRRVTTRVEDAAYCLMGLFEINMPMLYGEGEKSFVRLQEEIMKESNDESLFLWIDDSADSDKNNGLLATSPVMFKESGQFFPYYDWEPRAPFFKTNQGLQISLPLRRVEDNVYVASLNCCSPMRTDGFAGLYLKRITDFTDSNRSGYHDQYVRIRTDKIVSVNTTGNRGNVTTFYVRQSTVLRSSLSVYPEHIVQLRNGPGADQGYRLHGTMGVRPSAALNMDSWAWVPKGLKTAFQVPKDANRLAAVIVIARGDDTKFTILLGSAPDLGGIACHILDECDERRTFGEWASLFRPHPYSTSSYLQRERVWVEIKSTGVHERKYFIVDLRVEETPSMVDEVIATLEETPLREALNVMGKLTAVSSTDSELEPPVKARGKTTKFRNILRRGGGSKHG